MIAESAAAVAAWIADAVAPATVRTGPPGANAGPSGTADAVSAGAASGSAPPGGAGSVEAATGGSATGAAELGGTGSVVCYLYDVAPRERPRGLRREPLQFDLTYLVLAQAPDPATGHRLLDSVLSAAAQRVDVEIIDVGLSPQLWLAFGVLPQPAVGLRVVGRVERPEPDAPPVREPMIVRSGGARTLVGRVMSSTGVPIAMAEVFCPGIPAPALTGPNGGFSFAAVPPDLPPASFEVLARRARHVVSPEPDPSAENAILLVIDPIGVMP